MREKPMRDQDTRGLDSGAFPQGTLPVELRGRFGGHKPAFRVEDFAPKRWWVLDGGLCPA